MGCSSPSSKLRACRWRTTNVCDAWPVRRQTCSYLPSCKASPPIGWYQIILLGDRGTRVLTTCPGLHSTARQLGLLITSPAPYHYITEPHITRECVVLKAFVIWMDGFRDKEVMVYCWAWSLIHNSHHLDRCITSLLFCHFRGYALCELPF